MLSFTALRLLVASAILIGVSGILRERAPLHTASLPLGNAALAQTAFQLLLVAGLQRTTAGNSAILLATAPLIVAGWLRLVGRRPIRRSQVVGLLVGLCGVWVLVSSADGGGASGPRWLGDILSLGAAGAWAWYGLAVGSPARRVGTLQATAVTMAAAALAVIPLALPELLRLSWRAVSWPAWAGLLYGATLGMVVSMSLWGRSVARLGPTETMVYVYLEPVSAVVIAAILLGESFGRMQLLGAALTFVAVWLVHRGSGT
jgi:drug/metabolite transporter (DMT)-like permease